MLPAIEVVGREHTIDGIRDGAGYTSGIPSWIRQSVVALLPIIDAIDPVRSIFKDAVAACGYAFIPLLSISVVNNCELYLRAEHCRVDLLAYLGHSGRHI